MPPTFASEIDRLAAPDDDGRVLVWPDRDRLISMAAANHDMLARSQARVLDRSISDWRRERSDSLHILTGHQPSLFHAGVWAKNIAAVDLAADLGGSAGFLVVDSDVAHGIALAWPAVENGYCRLMQTMVEPGRQAHSFEQLTDFDAARYQAALRKLELPDAALPIFSDAACATHGDRIPYVSRWIRGMKAMEQAANVPPLDYVCTSDLFSPESTAPASAAAFVAHLLMNAGDFAAAYNGALAEYRSRRKLRGADHPIPDLAIDADRIEIPFWLLPPTEPRQRCFMSMESGDKYILWNGRQRQCELSRRDMLQTLASGLGGLSIRPRALTLMLYARLFSCDLFIHGIGGAKYDQITDEIMRRFFAIKEPPGYACISATLRLPLPTFPVDAADRGQEQRELRDIRFNPHRIKNAPVLAEPLIRREAAIAESNRLRRHDPRNRAARREAYERIHSANLALLPEREALASQTRLNMDQLDVKLESNRIARWREWFFAMHSLGRLQQLRESVRARLGT